MATLGDCGALVFACVYQVLASEQIPKDAEGCDIYQSSFGSVDGRNTAYLQPRRRKELCRRPFSEKPQVCAVQNALFSVCPTATDQQRNRNAVETYIWQTCNHFAPAVER